MSLIPNAMAKLACFFSISTLAFWANGGPLWPFLKAFGLLTSLYFESGATCSRIFSKLKHFKNNILFGVTSLEQLSVAEFSGE